MKSENAYVQFGSGLCGPESWLNFDVSPTLRLQRLPVVGRLFNSAGPRFPPTVNYGDIVDGLPIAKESCAAVYSSHVLEHLALDDMRAALANILKLLVPGGRFRFVVPDLENLARNYVESTEPDASLKFMSGSYLGKKSRPRGLKGTFRSALGNSGHLWMWDFASMSAELEAAGFSDIRRAAFGDSEDTMFDVVENESRWEDCLGIDCRRPMSETSPNLKAA